MIDLRLAQFVNIIKSPRDANFPRELIAFGYYGYVPPAVKRIVLMKGDKQYWYRIYFNRLVDDLPKIYKTTGNLRGDFLDLKAFKTPEGAYRYLTNNFILGPIRELRYI